jgi:hypothetical protein
MRTPLRGPGKKTLPQGRFGSADGCRDPANDEGRRVQPGFVSGSTGARTSGCGAVSSRIKLGIGLEQDRTLIGMARSEALFPAYFGAVLLYLPKTRFLLLLDSIARLWYDEFRWPIRERYRP